MYVCEDKHIKISYNFFRVITRVKNLFTNRNIYYTCDIKRVKNVWLLIQLKNSIKISLRGIIFYFNREQIDFKFN